MVTTTSSCASPKTSATFGIEDFRDRLHLEIVVAGAERSHLPALALLGALGNALGLGARHQASLLDPLKVARLAPAVFDRPSGATRQHGIHLDGVEGDRTLAADAGRDLVEQRFGKRLSGQAECRQP